MHHYLRPLLVPASIALVGASERPGSTGRVVMSNLLEGRYTGEFFPVNATRRKVLGRRAYASLAALRRPVDLVAIAVPGDAVPAALEDAARAKARAAIVLTAAPSGDAALARRWSRDLAAQARRLGIRMLGPGAFGVVRTDLGLNATYADQPVLPGRLALVAQSGAVCTAMLDFAWPGGIGFSTVVSVGGELDVGFGEILDALVADGATDGILLYVEQVSNARGFLSALRAAARTKPVVLLKAGRSLEPAPASGVTPDAVFDAAMRRAGTVRVRTYTQLFAAARLLALGRFPRGERIGVVANGRGPALLAADCARDAGIALATLEPGTVARLDELLPPESARENPVDVRGDADASRFAEAVGAVLADAQVDAVVALHVPRPVDSPTDAARAVAGVARASPKPVLGAWLGAVERPEARDALEAGGVANFYTPENAIEAFAFLAAYRRHQDLLLEVPPPQPDPVPPDLDAVERLRESVGERRTLDAAELHALLAAFGVPMPPVEPVETLADARRVARAMGYPVALALDAPGRAGLPQRGPIADGRALARAWGALLDEARAAWRDPDFRGTVLVRKWPGGDRARAFAVGIAHDEAFGPVITFGTPSRPPLPPSEPQLALPPLNRRLALDLLAGPRRPRASVAPANDAESEALVRLLLALSSLACACPWVRELALDPVFVAPGATAVCGAQVALDPRRKAKRGYAHMAIHPYPVELEGTMEVKDGVRLAVRPIRPEDAALEQRFVAGLSEESRYFRFFYRLHELTPQMLARFTQVDYDREMALVALAPDATRPGEQRFVGIARYIANPDGESAEFAVVVDDAWQGRGVARGLMLRLADCARRRGFARLAGAVLRANGGMIRFVEALGFAVAEDPDDPDQVIATLTL